MNRRKILFFLFIKVDGVVLSRHKKYELAFGLFFLKMFYDGRNAATDNFLIYF